MGATEFFRKQTPHFTPVLIKGWCALTRPAMLVFVSEMTRIIEKPVIRWYDFGIMLGLMYVAGIGGLENFMDRAYSRLMDDKESKAAAIENISK